MTTTLAENTATPPRAGARQWLGLAVLLLPVTLMTADLGVLWLATPYLSADLRPSGAQLLWITDIYGFLTAATLVIMGTLGDRLGRRRLLMAGSAGFLLASVLAAYAPNAGTLIAARALLGIAGAAVLPSTLALISHMFADARQRATAIAMWVTALSVGLAIGPVVGGVLLASWWWGSVFLMGLPVMLIALVTAPLLLPEYRDPNPGRLDPASVLLFLLAVLPLVYGVKSLAAHGPTAEAGTAFALGLAFTTLFVRRQNRLESPLLDLRLFRNRAFTGALLTLLLGMTALNGVEYLVPQYLQAVAGLPPLEAGLWLLPGAAGLIAGSQLTPFVARRIRPAYVLAGGLLVSLAGYAAIALAEGVTVAALGLAVIMFGAAPISVLGTALAVGSAPAEKAGAAAATGQTAYDLGLALGIAVTGSVAVAVYRGGIPADAPAAAHESVGAALTLPDEGLREQAREAFTTALQSASALSAAFALVTAVVVLTLLRKVPRS
ncbi:DHA2 family multidrug resistance protein-like MFS transporter [Streptomyces sp. PvR006]|uniref:MFS transporter n=1 Tax=Streptomyces sp. PvR006 TaxID=2817860 RepID=UPI001AE2C03F|nr:MFS transporter [Streptomyces sp. PvR006]MBP2582019.1 DHA2 family multidrug resistance protein-like MFS transporter [Streptomyces sp. PvR006]